jgi:hypothetical protein
MKVGETKVKQTERKNIRLIRNIIVTWTVDEGGRYYITVQLTAISPTGPRNPHPPP